MRLPLIVLLGFVFTACVPAHLQKYNNGKGTAKRDVAPQNEDDRLSNASNADESDIGPGSNLQAEKGSTKSIVTRPATGGQKRATVYATNENTFRFALDQKDVWDAALSVLLRNYNLTIVDKASGVITTEWDTFYLEQKVLRNKLTLRVVRVGFNLTEVVVRNNVEKLNDAGVQGVAGGIWLPSQDLNKEGFRVVQNMAIALNEPPPSLPNGPVANSEKGEANNNSTTF